MADSTYWVYILTSKPYGTLYAMTKDGRLSFVQLPNVRRIYLERAELERAIEGWKERRS